MSETKLKLVIEVPEIDPLGDEEEYEDYDKDLQAIHKLEAQKEILSKQIDKLYRDFFKKWEM